MMGSRRFLCESVVEKGVKPVCRVVPFSVDVPDVPHLCVDSCPGINMTFRELLRWYWRHPVCSWRSTCQWSIFGFQSPPFNPRLVPLRKLFFEGSLLLKVSSQMGLIVEVLFVEVMELLKRYEAQLFHPAKYFACGVFARRRGDSRLEFRFHIRFRMRSKETAGDRGTFYRVRGDDAESCSFEDFVFHWFKLNIGDAEARGAHTEIGVFLNLLAFRFGERMTDARLRELEELGAQ